MTGPVDIASNGAVYRGLADADGQRFVGIRYGQPPTGSLRFRAPRPHHNSGHVDATQYGVAAPQIRRP